MTKTQEFLKYIFVFEKTRWYSGGALRNPIPITQKFWDEMRARKEYYDKPRKKGDMVRSDTNYGSQTANLGARPVVPDWIVEFRGSILFMSAVIGWPILIALFLLKAF